MAKILILEDDRALLATVAEALSAKNHVVETVAMVQAANDLLAVSQFDLLILDWNVPDGEGVDVLRGYRKRGNSSPVLMLTAKSEITDKEAGFSAGTDDYLVKPFSLRELVLRVDALLRRPSAWNPEVLQSANITVDVSTFKVYRGNTEIRLLPKEFALLEFLLRHRNQVFSCEHLLQRVWSSDSESMPDTVVTTVKRLRQKIDEPGQPSIIENIRGVGYRIAD